MEEISKQCMNQAFPSQYDMLSFKRHSSMCTWYSSAKLAFFGSGHRYRVPEFWGEFLFSGEVLWCETNRSFPKHPETAWQGSSLWFYSFLNMVIQMQHFITVHMKCMWWEFSQGSQFIHISYRGMEGIWILYYMQTLQGLVKQFHFEYECKCSHQILFQMKSLDRI